MNPKKPEPADSHAETERLVHELEVHQIELQLQNEELKAARVETEASLHRYTELFDFAPVGYATLSVEGAIVEINHSGAAVLGVPRQQLLGARFQALVAPVDRRAFGALLVSAVSGVARGQLELELLREAGPVQVRLRAVSVTRAEPTVLLVFEDVSDTKERELKLRRTEQALRDADRRKDEFIASLSHELRNPLAPIRNSLFVLSHAKAETEQATKARAIIDRQITHLSRLVDDLLDVTRIARGKVELQVERVELSELVRRVVDDQQLGFDASGVQLEGRFEPGRFFVDGDAARLTQVLANLLGNAAKFTPRGGKVTVSLEREPDAAVLSVKDTGAGIEADLLPHVFESFVQAPQTIDRSRGGLGLGLAMVKGFVELHGGRVVALSQGLGRGTEIRARFPSRPEPVPSAPRRARPLEPRPRRVLVIEDSVDTADSLRDVLELTGHTVKCAYDGGSGIELARKFHPEVVFCDIGLPGMNGYRVAQAFRSDEQLKDSYLVALSGYARPEDITRATTAGFDQHISKPPRLEMLEKVLAEASSEPGEPASPPRADDLLH